ncbi:hypothetical protein K438DRAFT_2017633 [Mycena galopus ATCC 62051]|nr:hypothetical protein K438DRAFT_2017633 [Mycena galopus ATCC 62051]
MEFCALPPDVVLEIALQLDLADAMALLSTCRNLRGYSTEKSFWFPALARVRREQKHPTAVPINCDLSTLTMDEMREAGMRTNRLMKNWFSDSPKPESVREIHMDAMAEIIVIPGTNLVIAHGRAFVACWDIGSESCIGRLDLRPNLVVESASFEECGKVMLGVFSSNPRLIQVAAVCVDYHDRTAVSISLFADHTFALEGSELHKASLVTVDHKTVRVFAAKTEPPTYYLLSVSFAGEESIIENILPPIPRSSSAWAWGPPKVWLILSPHGPYFMRHTRTHADIAHLPLRSDARATIIQQPVPPPSSALEIRHYAPAAPTIGVVVFTLSGGTIVECWKGRPTNTGLAFDGFSRTLMDRVSNSVVGGASGVYTLLSLSGHLGPDSPLRLLRFVPPDRPVLVELKVPSVKTLYLNEGRLALDDHLGLILSLRGDGTLRIISYA